MTDQKHTPGPWVNDRGTIVTQPNGDFVQPIAECHLDARGSMFCIGAAEKDRNAARIVACVNALEGLDPEAIKGLIDAANQAFEIIDRAYVNKLGSEEFLDDAFKVLGKLGNEIRRITRA
ncbi:MAG: hypothetical protein GY737_00040 [Desulfobacteraceae bacterium]|nr:hypothetical protein [Desulfobacteraceae bacterium]